MTAIVGATVIHPWSGSEVENAVVLLQGGRILDVGPAGEIPLPAGATILDAAGAFLLPGLIDAHAHVGLGPVHPAEASGVPTLGMEFDREVPRRSLPLLLAHGITTILDPGGPTEVLLDLRKQVREGALSGPDMVVAGAIIDRLPFPGLTAVVETAEDIRAEVVRQADAGVDFVKLYATLTPDQVRAGVDEASAHGVPVLIHPMLTTWTDAAAAGVTAVLHIIPGSLDLLSEPARALQLQEMQRGTQFMFTWFEHADLHGPLMAEAIGALAEQGVVVDPTLVFFDVMARSDDPAVTEAPALEWVPPSLLENWRTDFQMTQGWTEEDFHRARAILPRMLELVRLLHDAGVPLAAGTDANNPWIVPGPSFHRELELLVEAGIPALEVLDIATRGNARYLGVLEDRGTIEAGKRADLVLVRSDPREDIRATREIEWVMRSGELRRPAELMAGLEPAARRR